MNNRNIILTVQNPTQTGKAYEEAYQRAMSLGARKSYSRRFRQFRQNFYDRFSNFCHQHKLFIERFYSVYKVAYWAFIAAAIIHNIRHEKYQALRNFAIVCTVTLVLWAILKFINTRDIRKGKFAKILVRVHTREDGRLCFDNPKIYKTPYRNEMWARGSQDIEILVEDLDTELNGTELNDSRFFGIVKSNGERDYSRNLNTYNPIHIDKELILKETPMRYSLLRNKLVPLNIAYKFGISKLSNLSK